MCGHRAYTDATPKSSFEATSHCTRCGVPCVKCLCEGPKPELWAIKVQTSDGSERTLYNVSSHKLALEIVDKLNRDPRNIAWCERRPLIGVKA